MGEGRERIQSKAWLPEPTSPLPSHQINVISHHIISHFHNHPKSPIEERGNRVDWCRYLRLHILYSAKSSIASINFTAFTNFTASRLHGFTATLMAELPLFDDASPGWGQQGQYTVQWYSSSFYPSKVIQYAPPLITSAAFSPAPYTRLSTMSPAMSAPENLDIHQCKWRRPWTTDYWRELARERYKHRPLLACWSRTLAISLMTPPFRRRDIVHVPYWWCPVFIIFLMSPHVRFFELRISWLKHATLDF